MRVHPHAGPIEQLLQDSTVQISVHPHTDVAISRYKGQSSTPRQPPEEILVVWQGDVAPK